MSRRIKSLHHNLGDKNVIFHREHRSSKSRRKNAKFRGLFNGDKKRKIEALKLKELENDI